MRRFVVSSIFAAGFCAAALFGLAGSARAQQQGSPLPDGEGRDIVAVACSQCHGLNAITQLRENARAWRDQVYDMVERGAQVTPAEMDTVVKYLSTSFGPGVPFPGQQPAQVNLPDGAGKEIVEGGCGLCHGLDRATAAKRSPADWQSVINRMVYVGAPLSADQAKAAVDYLSANFGSGGKTATAK